MKQKTTVYLDEEILRSARVAAAREGKRDSQVMEEALRAYLGVDLLDRVAERSGLSEAEAMTLANEERHR